MNSITLIENEIKRLLKWILLLKTNFFWIWYCTSSKFSWFNFHERNIFFFIIKRRKKYESKKITNTCNYAFFILIFEYTCNFCFINYIFFLSFIYINIKTMTLRQNMCLILVKFCVSYSWWTLRILVIKYFKSNMLFLNMYFNITWKKRDFLLCYYYWCVRTNSTEWALYHNL